ncbi:MULTISPECIES: 4'-phosphopantetheinyl transferase family protein [unclassified Prochlorococcus]|uniref:4'-phosphopantetheinyl transferase family protein n=1 Tax=unclassified Prochlorococcus TaxID=2627481 RepID=UPI0005336FBC|nr:MULTISPECIES: 4'-phosphopantetheinyl transferase superfamily protein [unclassified Prochlorococcus]KGG16862.1 4'-phosphopantetheinyl transferase related protein [Prochlorococcus sp. MIT 0602]KGG18164.1 4'-phosphopantetheinyl transferase related protein [Prochlorococcus sp. MIT 0603]
MKNTSVLPLWLFPTNSPLKKISDNEEKIANCLSGIRSHQYKLTRGYTRFALSEFLKINPLEIPLKSLPGEAPTLGGNLGYVSFSHCDDALLIGCSPNKLGVDIERVDRQFNARKIANRFYTKTENKKLEDFKKDEFRLKVLESWVRKEALIKWQEGTISKDLTKWNIDNQSLKAKHDELESEVNVYLIQYKSWVIGIASNQIVNRKNLIICSD